MSEGKNILVEDDNRDWLMDSPLPSPIPSPKAPETEPVTNNNSKSSIKTTSRKSSKKEPYGIRFQSSGSLSADDDSDDEPVVVRPRRDSSSLRPSDAGPIQPCITSDEEEKQIMSTKGKKRAAVQPDPATVQAKKRKTKEKATLLKQKVEFTRQRAVTIRGKTLSWLAVFAFCRPLAIDIENEYGGSGVAPQAAPGGLHLRHMNSMFGRKDESSKDAQPNVSGSAEGDKTRLQEHAGPAPKLVTKSGSLIRCAPPVVKECIFLLFYHHAVTHVKEALRDHISSVSEDQLTRPTASPMARESSKAESFKSNRSTLKASLTQTSFAGSSFQTTKTSPSLIDIGEDGTMGAHDARMESLNSIAIDDTRQGSPPRKKKRSPIKKAMQFIRKQSSLSPKKIAAVAEPTMMEQIVANLNLSSSYLRSLRQSYVKMTLSWGRNSLRHLAAVLDLTAHPHLKKCIKNFEKHVQQLNQPLDTLISHLYEAPPAGSIILQTSSTIHSRGYTGVSGEGLQRFLSRKDVPSRPQFEERDKIDINILILNPQLVKRHIINFCKSVEIKMVLAADSIGQDSEAIEQNVTDFVTSMIPDSGGGADRLGWIDDNEAARQKRQSSGLDLLGDIPPAPERGKQSQEGKPKTWFDGLRHQYDEYTEGIYGRQVEDMSFSFSLLDVQSSEVLDTLTNLQPLVPRQWFVVFAKDIFANLSCQSTPRMMELLVAQYLLAIEKIKLLDAEEKLLLQKKKSAKEMKSRTSLKAIVRTPEQRRKQSITKTPEGSGVGERSPSKIADAPISVDNAPTVDNVIRISDVPVTFGDEQISPGGPEEGVKAISVPHLSVYDPEHHRVPDVLSEDERHRKGESGLRPLGVQWEQSEGESELSFGSAFEMGPGDIRLDVDMGEVKPPPVDGEPQIDSEREMRLEDFPMDFPSSGISTSAVPSDRDARTEYQQEEITKHELDMTVKMRTAVTMASNTKDAFTAVPVVAFLCQEIMAALLHSGQWESRTKVVLKNFSESLDLDMDGFDSLVELTACEVSLVKAFYAGQLDPPEATQEQQEKKTEDQTVTGPQTRSKKKSKKPATEKTTVTTLATTTNRTLTVAGKHFNTMKILQIAGIALGVGAISALTAGLAAPAFAAGLGALGIAGAGGFTAFLGTAGGAASLATLFGASSAGLSGWKYSRRLAEIKQFEFVYLSGTHSDWVILKYVRKVVLRSEHQEKSIEGQMLALTDGIVDQKSTTEGDISQKDDDSKVRNARELFLRSSSSLLESGVATTNEHLEFQTLQQALAPTESELTYSPTCLTFQLKNRPKVKVPPFEIVVCVSGWLNNYSDYTAPWTCISDRPGTELFAIRWEPDILANLGTMMVRMVGENVASSAASLIIQTALTASTGLIMWPVSMLQYAGQLDNAWMTCRHRAQQAGALLAEALSDPALVGKRPVTLMGYSIGARVIAYALRKLFDKGNVNIVQNAILMGLPASKQTDSWTKMRAAVTDRLINIYSTTDWILAFLYRWMEWGVQVAGLSAVDCVAGVENYDVTGLVYSHNQYEKKIAQLLSVVKFHVPASHKDALKKRKRAPEEKPRTPSSRDS